ncbi:MAG: RDD family protein [Planctomycetia bacterium]|nr:RDD family protein [Planctomycetia bacterium]MCC7314378.1 RDD family protein [Planctomycetota bacterium]OQZ06892.1 MAG: hypothetical protein B6D36_02675 [Planctomycetes bacterium UTPLA1]
MATAVAREMDQFNCPICDRACTTKKSRKLYDVRVCKKCSNGFASRRQGAYIIDSLLLYVLSFISGFVMALMFPEVLAPTTGETLGVTIFWYFHGWVLLPLLFCFKDGFKGCSPGRWLCGVRVVDRDTRDPIHMTQSLKRNLILMIPVVPLIIAFQLIRGVRYGDEWAKTRVVWKKYIHRVPFDPRGILCTNCGYDLTGNVSGRCPECGKDIPRTNDAARTTPPGIPSSHIA